MTSWYCCCCCGLFVAIFSCATTIVGSNNEEEDDDDEIDYNFPAALKTFVYSVLDVNGDPGLPWQTLLLYLCRDESQEMALRKAFTVLSCNMYKSALSYPSPPPQCNLGFSPTNLPPA
jgi:hypothetical protein